MWVWWWPESSGGWEVTRLHDLLSPVSIHQQRPVTFVCVIFKFNSLSLKWQNVPGTFCIRMKAFSTNAISWSWAGEQVLWHIRGEEQRWDVGRGDEQGVWHQRKAVLLRGTQQRSQRLSAWSRRPVTCLDTIGGHCLDGEITQNPPQHQLKCEVFALHMHYVRVRGVPVAALPEVLAQIMKRH